MKLWENNMGLDIIEGIYILQGGNFVSKFLLLK